MDAMTYGALAKNILSTGDWKVLHYTPSAYADFYQHPPLVMWLISFLCGLCITGALLSKGMVGLILPFGLFTYTVIQLLSSKLRQTEPLKNFLFANLFTVIFMGAWFIFGDGAHYVQEYWRQSVSSRVTPKGFWDQLGAIRNLLRTYWPWFPFFLWGSFQVIRTQWKKPGELSLVLIMGFGILFAFSYTGHFLEHYLVPFYPFAAILVAHPLRNGFQKHEERITPWVFRLTVLAAVTLATLPISIHGDRSSPLIEVLEVAHQHCHSDQIKEVLITRRAEERWRAIASGLWKTDWEIQSLRQLPSLSQSDQLLITFPDENVSEEWTHVKLSPPLGRDLYVPKGSVHCK
jgi:4-amino-4-deoxy-L-arabinose transferase-like glycosyltransferase